MEDTRGRGPIATADMKARVPALLRERYDWRFVIDQLWERNRDAVLGDGFTYEFAEGSDSIRSARDGD